MSKELIKRLFVVHKCAACRRILSAQEYERALCERCELYYRIALTEGCSKCFRSAIECRCQPKLLERSGSRTLCKLFFYHAGKEREPQNRLVYFFKHNKGKRALDFIARELWAEVRAECEKLLIDENELIFTNVPRGKKALHEYGFDQSAEICKAMSRVSGVPYAPLIKRRYGGREQKKLSAAERRKNLKDRMKPHKKYAQLAEGRYVMLFDDIVTTGASMSACLPSLRKMGVKGVFCACLASDVKKKKDI